MAVPLGVFALFSGIVLNRRVASARLGALSLPSRQALASSIRRDTRSALAARLSRLKRGEKEFPPRMVTTTVRKPRYSGRREHETGRLTTDRKSRKRISSKAPLQPRSNRYVGIQRTNQPARRRQRNRVRKWLRLGYYFICGANDTREEVFTRDEETVTEA